MTPRSLVGMTMGARKRAAIYDVVGHRFRKAVKLTWFKCWNRDYHGRVPTIDDIKTNDRYQNRRLLFRLGQRLRPCPGCKDCGTGKSGRTWRLRLGDQLWISGSLKVKDPAHICDGSGAIPAKARKVRR